MAVCYQTSLILAVRNRRYRFAQSGTHNSNLEVLFFGCAGGRDLHGLRFGACRLRSRGYDFYPCFQQPWQFDNVLFYVGIPNMSEYLTLFSPTQHQICRQWASMLAVNDALAYELAYYSCNDFFLANT
jgi:hypothetical protein